MQERLKVLIGDCRETLRTLEAGSVQCCVTSPPYWGLRSYLPKGHPDKGKEIGSEMSPGEFVETMVAVFAEVWRVLRDDGTVWLNLGDSYASASSGAPQSGLKALSDKCSPRSRPRQNHAYQDGKAGYVGRGTADGFKAKDLIGIPWRVALALQAAGWYLRCDIVWAKKNCLPESVRDRPTKSHEYIFLLSKKPHYFYDAEAIMEPVTGSTHARCSQNVAAQAGSTRANGGRKTNGAMKAVMRPPGVNPKAVESGKGNRANESFSAAVTQPVSVRNKRTVWHVPAKGYAEAHFATFPKELITPCVLAGTSAHGACVACRAPYARVVERGAADLEHQRACGGDLEGAYSGQATKDFASAKAQDASATKARILAGMRERATTGWVKTCACEAPGRAPCVVLDPFGGSGTTGEVAIELGRAAVLCELNPEYGKLIAQRTAVTPGLGL